MKSINRLTIVFYLLMIVFFVILGITGFLLLDIINPPVSFKLNRPLTTLEKTVKQGGDVTVVLDYCKYTDETPLTYFVITDGQLLPAVPLLVVLEQGCHVRTFPINLAFSVPVGRRRVAMIKNYTTLVFRGKTQTYFSNYFEVTSATDEGAVK